MLHLSSQDREKVEMKIRYDEAQDLTLLLTEEEEEALLKGPTEHFCEMHQSSERLAEDGLHYILLRGLCRELGAYVYLGYSRDKDNIFREALSMDGHGKILIPDPNYSELPWDINLSEKGIQHYRKGWEFGIRYDEEHKLFIRKELTKTKIGEK